MRELWEDVKYDVALSLGLLSGAVLAAALRLRKSRPGGTP